MIPINVVPVKLELENECRLFNIHLKPNPMDWYLCTQTMVSRESLVSLIEDGLKWLDTIHVVNVKVTQKPVKLHWCPNISFGSQQF